MARDILEKQYRNYAWNDQKMLAIITSNSIFFAAVGFMFQSALNDILASALVVLAMMCLSASVFLCVIHAIPRMRSGKSGDSPNPGSIMGITSHEDWHEYDSDFCKQGWLEALSNTLRQVYGMATNNLRSYRLLRGSAWVTLIGVGLVLAATIAIALSSKGLHLLGEWPSTPAVNSSQTPAVDHESLNEPPSESMIMDKRGPFANDGRVAPGYEDTGKEFAPPTGVCYTADKEKS